MSTPEHIQELVAIIRRLHRCNARHVGTTRVVEQVPGRVLWEGDVETFELSECSTAQRCHAWCEPSNGHRHPHVVLETGTIVGPHSAVASTF